MTPVMLTAPVDSRTLNWKSTDRIVVTMEGETPRHVKPGGVVSILTVTDWGVSWMPALLTE